MERLEDEAVRRMAVAAASIDQSRKQRARGRPRHAPAHWRQWAEENTLLPEVRDPACPLSAAVTKRSAGRDDTPPEVRAWIREYRPRVVKPEDWTRVRPFVLEQMAKLNFVSQKTANDTIAMLTKLAVWWTGPLDAEKVLHPNTVKRFCATALKDDTSRGTYRYRLQRIGPLLTTEAPWEPPEETMNRRILRPPYTRLQLDQLEAAIRAQSTYQRRRGGEVIFVLGRSAGLDARWNTKVRPVDVVRTPYALTVAVGEPSARVVPVLAEYEDRLLELCRTAGAEDEYLVGVTRQTRNLPNQLAARIEVPSGVPSLESGRLRSTWLVDHISRGTRLPDLAEAAGLKTITSINDLLGHVPLLPEAERQQHLRGNRL